MNNKLKNKLKTTYSKSKVSYKLEVIYEKSHEFL